VSRDTIDLEVMNYKTISSMKIKMSNSFSIIYLLHVRIKGNNHKDKSKIQKALSLKKMFVACGFC